MRVLAIIPARGGSKGVPGKNLRALGGLPLIAWSIRSALAAEAVTDTVVSTDSNEIADVAREHGAQVPFLRPAELATDKAPTEPAMHDALERMEAREGRYDAVLLLQPTSPLRKSGTIDRALAQFRAEGADSLVGVVESHAFFWRKSPQVKACYDYANRPRRQDIAPADRRFRETGSIYVTARETFLSGGNRLGGRIALFEMAEEEGWEIDSLADFAVIEALAAQTSAFS
jgi:N-acylneuraminate cytidylyltransferase